MFGRSREKRPSTLLGRYLAATLIVVCSLGIACVMAVTAAFALSYYAGMEADLRYRAKITTEFFSDALRLDYGGYYQSCISYAQTFQEKDRLELQFINANGQLVASSYGPWAGNSPTTPEIQEAVRTRGICPYLGRDPETGERIIAVSSPMIYSNGEVIGVLRYVTSTRRMDGQIALVAAVSLLALAIVAAATAVSGSLYIRSVLYSLDQITQKANRIAGGSYGIQIQTKYNDELGKLAEAINDLSSAISQNEKIQADFISSLSHELRTPLTAITGWSETLLDEESLDPETERGVRIIQKEAKRLTEMVVGLLDFTRLQDGRMTLNIEQADIRGEFEDIVYMYRSRLTSEGIALEYEESDDPLPTIPCDPKRMRQVFLNILDNAAKHGGEGKRIQASIAADQGGVAIRIRDFGPGIPEDELPLVKMKFYKGSSKARGTGIGLAVCEEIVQMHGGSLTLENAQGGGTLVTVWLPAAQ